MSHEISEASRVDRAYLFDQDTSRLAGDVGFGAE